MLLGTAPRSHTNHTTSGRDGWEEYLSKVPLLIDRAACSDILGDRIAQTVDVLRFS
jgi:hypothetical protein